MDSKNYALAPFRLQRKNLEPNLCFLESVNSATTSENSSTNEIVFIEIYKTQEQERERYITPFNFFQLYTPELESEERILGVSTRLNLYEDPFKITKFLTESDVNDMCRLLLKSKDVREHILGSIGAEREVEVETEEGMRVTVWDYDTGSGHPLVFKRWSSSKSYVFTDNWMIRFVTRRDLKRGDQIGLFWDQANSRFGFRVLSRAPQV